MKCPECQSENSEEAKFCGKCGEELFLICHSVVLKTHQAIISAMNAGLMDGWRNMRKNSRYFHKRSSPELSIFCGAL